MTVADHQPVTILIDLLGMGVDVGRHLRLQGDREHLPRSLAHDLIEHRTARLVGLGLESTISRMGVPSRPQQTAREAAGAREDAAKRRNHRRFSP